MEGDRSDRVEQLEQHVARLDREVARLRSRLDRADTAADAVTATESALTPPVSAAAAAPPAWPAPHPAPPADTGMAGSRPWHAPKRMHLDSEAVLKWGGVGLVVLAVGFAVSTAISRDWIGPELQLAGALVVSSALVAAGLRLRPARPRWTHALCSGGLLAFFTTFASNLFLDRVDETAAFVATAAIAAGGLALARTTRSEWVAAATLIGGSIGWTVIADSREHLPFAATVVWFVLIVAATIVVSVDRRWFAARPTAHMVAMIALPALASDADGTARSILLAAATASVAGSLFVVPSIGDLTSAWQQFEVQLAALAAPWAFTVTLIAFLDDHSDTSIAVTAFAIAAGTGAAAIALPIRPPHKVSLALGASVTFSIGLAVLLSATAVFVALAVQAAGLVILSRALGRNVRILINAVVLATIAVANTLATMFTAWSDDAAWGDDVAHLLVIIALAVGIWFIDDRDVRRAGAVATLALLLIWTGSVFVHAPQGQAVVSVVWATLGTTVFVTGAVRRRADAATTGLAVLGLTVGKLLTVDLQEVDTLWRAGLFFLIGIGLLRLGFLLPRLTRGDHNDSSEAADEPVPEHARPHDTHP